MERISNSLVEFDASCDIYIVYGSEWKSVENKTKQW